MRWKIIFPVGRIWNRSGFVAVVVSVTFSELPEKVGPELERAISNVYKPSI